ncbi:MAG: uroporphyrinogen decarboxylase family protein [Promethearchaeota archaeon]|jgi:uroporphyrinogen decarboxylase
MNSYDRIWAALNLEEPDRIPIHTINIDGNIADQILGKPKRTAFDIFDDMEREYPEEWIEKINAILLDIEISTFSKAVRAGYELGFDGVGVQYIPFILENRTEMTDIFGKRHRVRNIGGNPYPDYYGGYIKNRADWEAYKKPNLKDEYNKAKKFYKGVLRKCRDIKDDICIIAQNALTSVFPPVWQGMGMNYFARALKNDPQLIEERFRYSTDYVLTVFKAYADCGAKIFLEGGDIAHKSGPMINPKYFDQYLLPCYKEVSDAIHEWGGKYMLHSDGEITSLLNFIIDSGFDGLQCLEPPFVDPVLVKKKVGEKLCLSGNIDTRHILVDASKDEVDSAVKSAIKALGHGGGYMLSPANFHPGMSVKRLKWMIETGKSFGTYPLAL